MLDVNDTNDQKVIDRISARNIGVLLILMGVQLIAYGKYRVELCDTARANEDGN